MYAVLDEIRDLLQTNLNTVHAAEAGTTTTNIKVTDHGLITGDVIVNTTRASATRTITVVDANNFTVDTVTGQTTSDSITFHKFKKYYVGKIDEKTTIPHNHLPILMVYGETTDLVDGQTTSRDKYERRIVIQILTSSFGKVTSSEDNGDLQAQKQIMDLMEELDGSAIPKSTTILGVLRRNIRLTYSLFNDKANIIYDDFKIDNRLYFRGTLKTTVTRFNDRT